MLGLVMLIGLHQASNAEEIIELSQIVGSESDPKYLCEHTDVKFRFIDDRLIVLKFAEDETVPGQVSKTDIKFGCELKSSRRTKYYGSYSGKCKLAKPPSNCPTCTWNLGAINFIEYKEVISIDGGGSHTPLSGLYQICNRSP